MRRSTAVTIVVSMLACLALARAQSPSAQQLGVFVYPAKGQPAEQQQAEEAECYGWAQKQTGIDPTAPVAAATPPPQSAIDGSAVKGAAGGAAVGTAIGA